jgi:hypothetical protein
MCELSLLGSFNQRRLYSAQSSKSELYDVCTVPHLEPFVYVDNFPLLLRRMGAVQD